MSELPASPRENSDKPIRRRFSLLRRFRRDNRAATVVEFALVALPFFGLMFAILETFLLFFASQTVETATNSGARLIRTGQAQSAGLTAETFKERICAALVGLFNCEANLMVDVRTYDFFEQVDMGAPIDENGNLVQNFVYQPGVGGDVVVVRSFLEWPIHTNILGLGLANLGNGNRLIAAATAFRNEPF
jgi:Flp pilus assembly protein TadG